MTHTSPRQAVLCAACLLAAAAAAVAGGWEQAVDADFAELRIEAPDAAIRLELSPTAETVTARGDGTQPTIELDRDAQTVRISAATDEQPVELVIPAALAVHLAGGTAPVRVHLAPAASSAAVTVTTTTGSITVDTAPGKPPRFQLATSGEITTDFSIEIDQRWGEEPAKHGRISAASGNGPQVTLSSLRGTISVLRDAPQPHP